MAFLESFNSFLTQKLHVRHQCLFFTIKFFLVFYFIVMTQFVGFYVEGPVLFKLKEFVELSYEVFDEAIPFMQSLFLTAFYRDVEIVQD
jgi:hypothetical protein